MKTALQPRGGGPQWHTSGHNNVFGNCCTQEFPDSSPFNRWEVGVSLNQLLGEAGGRDQKVLELKSQLQVLLDSVSSG